MLRGVAWCGRQTIGARPNIPAYYEFAGRVYARDVS